RSRNWSGSGTSGSGPERASPARSAHNPARSSDRESHQSRSLIYSEFTLDRVVFWISGLRYDIMFEEQSSFERMSAMAAIPNSADPGWDDELAWLDRDPATPEELEAALDRLCELDGPDPEEGEG